MPNPPKKATFPLAHEAFYTAFTPWQAAQQAEGQPDKGLYFLKTKKPIPRAMAKDYRGILYIGQGNVLPYHNRLGELVNACNGTSEQHHAGVRYREQ